jgi:pimeloyl-ACP methyl ester carboxylesterase
MYMNGESWKPWVERAESQGFTAVAPSWPYHQGDPKYLRTHIDPALGKLQFRDIVNFYKKFIDSLPERPLLIGHSIGGLVVQKLVNDGFAAKAVAISSAPPQGVITLAPDFFKANFPHINPFAGNKPVIMTKKRFHYTFCNTQSQESSDLDFDQFVVPESRNVPRSTLTSQSKIKFNTEHVPLLLIAGEKDHLIPLGLAQSNFRRYKKSKGITEFLQFPNRSHFICNQEGWEEVADLSFNWLGAH